jgi:hypothetical protein
MIMEDRRPYRSLFWPILLIGIGVIWLMSNMNLIPEIGLGVLLRLWPVLLIVAGLDMIFGRISPLVGALIGVLAIIFIVMVLFAAPALGLPAAPQVVNEQFFEPLGQAASATIVLDLSSPRTSIRSISGTEYLLDATVDHLGDVSLTSSGVENRRVTLRRANSSVDWFDTLGSGPMHWNIGLSSEIPLDLTIDSSSGGGDFNLSGLMLTRLVIDSGSGSIGVNLPDTDEDYIARVDSGSGSVDVAVPCSNIELRLDGGSGSVRIDVPQDCPLRVEVLQGGSGSVNVPSDLEQIRGDRNEGVWESDHYDGTAERVLIVMENQGAGSFAVRSIPEN